LSLVGRRLAEAVPSKSTTINHQKTGGRLSLKATK
jgi:hypothetical protein